MAKRFKQVVVYAKLTVVVLLGGLILIVILKNWSYRTRFWPGAADRDVRTLWLMLATGLLSIVIYWILSKTRRIYRDLAELRAEQLSQQRRTEQEKRQKALLEQERRIDEKLKNALEEGETGPE